MKKFASLVAPIEIKADGIVFYMQRRVDAQFLDQLEFPGGKIEAGETPKQAAVREFHEECEIQIEDSACHEFSVNYHDYGNFEVMLYSFYVKTSNIKLGLAQFEQVFISYQNYDEEIKTLNVLAANKNLICEFVKFFKSQEIYE